MNELNELKNLQSVEMPYEFLQPWSTFVMKTKILPQYIEILIKITDEILEKNKLSERFGHKLAGEIDDEFLISPEHFNQYFYILAFIDQACSWYYSNQLAQGSPDIKEQYMNQEWVSSIDYMWVVSQKDNEYNPIHEHEMPGSMGLSAVIWLKIPEYLPSRKKHNPDAGAITFIGNAQYKQRPPMCTNTLTLHPQVGDFCIFPSQLQHTVYPFKTKDGKGERRSVSLNLGLDTMENYQKVMKQQNDIKGGIVSGKEETIKKVEKDTNPWLNLGILPKYG
jgi:hypothetical protein